MGHDFKVGDKVVCIDNKHAEDWLDIGRVYVTNFVDEYNIGLVEDSSTYPDWSAARFEHLEEWEKHQKTASCKTELALTKLQVQSLQKWRKEALFLLHAANNKQKYIFPQIEYFLENNTLDGYVDED